MRGDFSSSVANDASPHPKPASRVIHAHHYDFQIRQESQNLHIKRMIHTSCWFGMPSRGRPLTARARDTEGGSYGDSPQA
eukprot:3129770-Prymnesium_polylepis.1